MTAKENDNAAGRPDDDGPDHEGPHDDDSRGNPSVNPPLNPYAAPILDESPALQNDGELDPAVDIQAVEKKAKWFITTGAILAVVLIGVTIGQGFLAVPLISILQFVWAYPALRHSSKYARSMRTGIRVGLRIILVFHVFVLAIETAVALLFVTCFAIVSTVGN